MPVFEATNRIPHGDLSAQNRLGHPQIRESDEYLMGLFDRYVAGRDTSLSVFNFGAGSGYFVKQLVERHPSIEMVAQEDHPVAIERLRARMAGSDVKLHIGPFDDWTEPVDVVLSEGAHHHLPRSYLQHARRILKPGGVLLISDEFCPEYCFGPHAERISNASTLYLANGFVLTQPDEIAAFEESGEIPEIAQEQELLRLRALWTWYRYVVDSALELGCLETVQAELRGARDDFDTACGDEHKLSPLIVERELDLAGFAMRSRHSVAPSERPELQSFFVYEHVPQEVAGG